MKKKKKKRDLAQDVSNWVDIFWKDRSGTDIVLRVNDYPEVDAEIIFGEAEEQILLDLERYDEHQRNEIEAWDLTPRGME